MKLLWAVLLGMGAFTGTNAKADERDQDIFGADTPKQESTLKAIAEQMQVGGAIDVTYSYAKPYDKSFSESTVATRNQGMIYFDSRPHKDFRSFLRLLVNDYGPSVRQTPTTQIDEAWIKATYQDRLFFTLGKQHLKWGSGRIWNPTDFTALAIKNPFAQRDERLGVNLIKIHYPMEKEGYNFYLVGNPSAGQEAEQSQTAVRSEFVLGQSSELALSLATQTGFAKKLGVDFSTGLSIADLYTEVAITKNEKQRFFERSGLRFFEVSKSKETLKEMVLGSRLPFSYNNGDTATLGAEVFANDKGYDDKDQLLYAISQGASNTLYAAKSYAALYGQFIEPYSFNKSSYFVNYIVSQVDQTSIASVTGVYQMLREAQLEATLTKCFGDTGEFCMKDRAASSGGTSSSFIPPEQTLSLGLRAAF